MHTNNFSVINFQRASVDTMFRPLIQNKTTQAQPASGRQGEKSSSAQNTRRSMTNKKNQTHNNQVTIIALAFL